MVDAAAGEGQLAAHRADVHDPAPALAAHARQRELAHPDQAEDVGLELAADRVEVDRLDRARLAVAGVVHEHADRALGLDDGVDAGAHRGLVGDVAGERLAAGLGQVGERLGAARGGVDGPALRREVARGLVADARRASGDQDRLGDRRISDPLGRWRSGQPMPTRLGAVESAPDASGHVPGARRGPGRREARSRADGARTRRSSGSRPAASAARTSTSTTGASRSSPGSRSGTSTSAP